MIVLMVFFSSLIPVDAYTLTLKTDKVIGADGKVYKGASPTQLEAGKKFSRRVEKLIWFWVTYFHQC